MSVRSYSKIWLHLVWVTHNREKSLADRELRKKLSDYYYKYSLEKNIYMKVNFVNSDHVHALIDCPTDKSIADVLHLYKGSSSYWINKQVNYKFSWAKGYAAFSVSESVVNTVVKYIVNQEEHHAAKSFSDEYEEFLQKTKLING